MNLHDFLFEHSVFATKHELSRVSAMGAVRGKWAARHAGTQRARIAQLESDIGYLALVLGALLESLNTRGVLTKADVKQTMTVLDDVDGVKHGKFDVNLLRKFGDAADGVTDPTD